MTKKISQLYSDNPISSFDKSDLFVLDNDVLVTPDTGATRYGDLLADMLKGWIPSFDTWTYASASTFTVSGDKTAIYTKGTKIKWTQTTVKYGIVLSSTYAAPNTTVTIIVNTDYVITNAAISANFYSYQDSPFGYPTMFNYTPTWTAATVNPTLGDSTLTGKFNVRQGKCFLQIYFLYGSTATSGTGAWRFSIPITVSASSIAKTIGNTDIRDAGTNNYERFAILNPTSVDCRIFVGLDNGTNLNTIEPTIPFTWGNGDNLSIQIEYEI